MFTLTSGRIHVDIRFKCLCAVTYPNSDKSCYTVTGLGRLRRALVGSQRRFSASTHYWCLRYINAATLSTNLSATCQSPCRPPRWPPRRPPCRPPVRSPRQSPCRPPCRVGKSDINSTDTYLTTKKIAPKTHKLWQIQLCDKTLSSPIDHKNNIISVFFTSVTVVLCWF